MPAERWIHAITEVVPGLCRLTHTVTDRVNYIAGFTSYDLSDREQVSLVDIEIKILHQIKKPAKNGQRNESDNPIRHNDTHKQIPSRHTKLVDTDQAREALDS